jgi:hypothetical protein
MDSRKIQQLRAAVLDDLKDFRHKDYYKMTRTDSDLALKDYALAGRILHKHYHKPMLNARQFDAVLLLESLGLCGCEISPLTDEDIANGLTIANMQATQSIEVIKALNRYALNLPEAEKIALHAGFEVEPQPVTGKETSEDAPQSIKIRTNKLRRNTLDPAIDKAIKEAGSLELASVFLKLKELALFTRQ